MKKRMKKVATLCLAGVTAMSTVGVTGSAVFAKGDTNYDVDNMDFENVELRVAFRFNNGSDTDGQAKWYYKALDEFNKENEGKIHVTDESISTESDYEEKLTTDFASGNVPNAFLQYGGSRTREYVDAGYILDLTPYFEQYPEWKEGVQDFAWETTQFDGIEGTYGIPWSAYQLCLYYNKDYLDQVGVDVPESWDDLASDKEAYNGEKMVAIYQKMKDMIDAGYWGDGILSTDFNTERNMFEAGKAAFTVDGTWNCGNFQNDSDTTLFDAQKIGVTRIPYIDEANKTVEMGGGSDTYYITTLNKSDEEIAATVKFIKYLTSVDSINEMCKSSPTTYAEKVTIDTGNYLLDDVNAIMAENTESKLEIPTYDSNTAAMDTIRNSLQALATGASAQEVGDDIVDKMSAYE